MTEMCHPCPQSIQKQAGPPPSTPRHRHLSCPSMYVCVGEWTGNHGENLASPQVLVTQSLGYVNHTRQLPADTGHELRNIKNNESEEEHPTECYGEVCLGGLGGIISFCNGLNFRDRLADFETLAMVANLGSDLYNGRHPATLNRGDSDGSRQ